jgi:hypothetical protein
MKLMCWHCGSPHLVRNGLTHNGKQRDLCNECGRTSRTDPQPTGDTDFREAYRSVVPAEQHTAAGQETGVTAQVERGHNTLRQRLGRFVRQSLSCSRSEAMHELCVRLFLHVYHRSLALASA